MCKQIKRLTELSKCPHLNKTDRDALTWAIYQIQPPKVEPDKGFDGFDFSSWPTIPSKELFDEVRKARKSKHGVIMTQSWIDSAGPHLHFLNDKFVDVNTSMGYCAKNGWQGFGAKWVMNEIDKDRENMPKEENVINKNISEQDYINKILLGEITHISQIKGYKNIMTSNYAKGIYDNKTMQALENIGFAV